MITKKLFDKFNGEDIFEYTVDNGQIALSVINLGATVTKLVYCGVDVALGFTGVTEKLSNTTYMGATIGRCANRMGSTNGNFLDANGDALINGKKYRLALNDGNAHLHGGECGFDRKVFTAKETENGVSFFYQSPDGEEGYPSTVDFTVTYRLEQSAVVIEYYATTDGETVFAPTNHTYFNLNGEGDGEIGDHLLQINADSFLAVNKDLLPVKLTSVSGTPFDFRTAKPIGKDVDLPDEQLLVAGGFDHNFCLNGETACEVYSPKTKIAMQVITDMPGVQFYSGNFLNGEKGKSVYNKRSGFCLETQYYPNAVNNPSWKSPLLRRGDKFYSKTQYVFSIKNK